MDPLKIIRKHYKPGTKSYYFLTTHGKQVMKKSIKIAKNVKHPHPNLKFIKEAAMLHDIGIFQINAPDIGCHGKYHYLYHGYLGRKILDKENLHKHALVCERHIGVGLTLKDIIKINKKYKTNLPLRNMMPLTIEEKIITYADKFFTKHPMIHLKERKIKIARKNVGKYGKDKVKIFDEWVKLFERKI